MTFRQQFQSAMTFLAGVVCACWMMDFYIRAKEHDAAVWHRAALEIASSDQATMAVAEESLKICYQKRLGVRP